MRSLFENPDFLTTIAEADPRLREALAGNPELRAALRDPETLRMMTAAAANPRLQQELMRQQDQALARVESLPGGWDALTRAHAMLTPADEEGAGALRPGATLGGGGAAAREAAGEGAAAEPAAPTNDPLPNPWGRAGSATRGPGGLAAPPFGGLGGGLFGAGFPGLFGAPGESAAACAGNSSALLHSRLARRQPLVTLPFSVTLSVPSPLLMQPLLLRLPPKQAPLQLHLPTPWKPLRG